jgi:hypothetical protein
MVDPVTKYWQELYRQYTDFLPYRDGYYRLLGEDDPADPAPFGVSGHVIGYLSPAANRPR